MNEVTLLEVEKDLLRERLCKYTRKAFHMLPKLDKPRILDIGCGSGISTMQLARLSEGEIIGLDIDQNSLDRLAQKIDYAELSDRVKTINCSMLNMDFPDESFDIIWAEGSIYAIGFKRGLQEWKRYLRSGGFIVIHDEQGNVSEKLEQVSNCGYELLGYFTLSKDTWWIEYFAPLEKLIAEFEIRQNHDPITFKEITKGQLELDMFKKYPERNSSAYFVIKKN